MVLCQPCCVHLHVTITSTPLCSCTKHQNAFEEGNSQSVHCVSIPTADNVLLQLDSGYPIARCYRPSPIHPTGTPPHRRPPLPRNPSQVMLTKMPLAHRVLAALEAVAPMAPAAVAVDQQGEEGLSSLLLPRLTLPRRIQHARDPTAALNMRSHSPRSTTIPSIKLR